MSKDSCNLEPDVSIEYRLKGLIARGLVTPANSMPIRVLNVKQSTRECQGRKKGGDLLPIEPTVQQLCLTTVVGEQ